MKNDRYIVIAVVLVALAAAAGMNGGTQAVEVGAGVTIEASGGPNSQYVTVDDTGNISIDLSDSNEDVAGAGVNDDAVVRFDNVFLISNTNDRRAFVYVSDETDAIEFVESGQGVGGTGSSIEGRDNEVALDGGEQLTFGFAVDTNQIDDIETTFTLVVRVTESAEEPPTTTPTTTEPQTQTGTPTEPDGLDPVIGLVIAIIVVVAAAIGALLYWPRVSGSE